MKEKEHSVEIIEDDDQDEDESEEGVTEFGSFAGFDLKMPMTGKTSSSLEQARAQTETVFEPYIFLSPNNIYVIWWKSAHHNFVFEIIPKAVKVTLTTASPTQEQIAALSTQIPMFAIQPLVSTFVVALPCQIWPNGARRIDTADFIGVSATINTGKDMVVQL